GLGRPATGAAVAPDPGRRPAHAARPRPGRVAPPPARAAVWRLAAAPLRGFRRTLDERGFTEIPSPKLVGGSAESGADVFAVDHFGRPAYLAQSPQFYKQILVGVFERVYEVGPVFRAEPHDTARHLAQYTSLDAELGFITDHRDVMAVVREALAGMLAAVADRAGAALAALDVLVPVVPATIPAVPFTQARVMALGEWAAREPGSDVLFVTGYAMAKRPFYTHPDPASPAYANGFDLLFRGVELVTGGQRRHRYEDYLAALAAIGEPLEPYRWYVETFRHGMPPHGGFAIGLERFVAKLIGAVNVREVTAFPRDLRRVVP